MRGHHISPLLLLGSALLGSVLLGSFVTAQAPVAMATALQASSFCYDEVRQRLVVPQASGGVVEWDGQHWAQVSATLPAAEAMTVIAYEPTRQRAYGRSGNRMVAYDGHGFTDHGPWPTGQTTGTLHADRQGGLLLLRHDNGSVLFDRWDGSSWLSLPTPGTGQRVPNSAAYDHTRRVLVAQFVRITSGIAFETWEWDGNVWTLRFSNNQTRPGICYDSSNQRILSVASQTFTWTGTAWVLVATNPGPLNPTVTASDPSHGRVWAWNQVQGTRHFVWTFDGSAWSSMPAPHPHVGLRTMAYDERRDRTILFGYEPTLGGNTHHEWDGNAWRELPTGSGPSTRAAHSLVYDPVRQETLVFGGNVGPTRRGDTWAWNGTSWRLAATTGPSPRNGAPMAFDRSRGRMVLVGGTTQSGVVGDHWEWDGQTWTQIAATTPIGAVTGMLGFDEARNRLVLLDGIRRTWEHNGTQWAQVGGTGPRLQGDDTKLVWDAGTQRLQANLFDSNFLPYRHSWDGSTWTIAGDYVGVLAYDGRRGTLLTCNVAGLQAVTAQAATAVHFGTPCGGSTTATSLTAFGLPRPGNRALHVDLRAEATQRPAMLGLALQSTNLALGNGCTMHLQNPFATAIWFTDANGLWHHPLALPDDMALRGVQFVAQGAVLDPASAGGFALTQGLSLTIGD